MRNRQSLTKILMFMLPAVLTIAAYTTFYDNLFNKPACNNCETFTEHSNGFDLRNILDLIDQLRLALAAKDARLKYSQSTPLDLTLLKEKLDAFEYDIATEHNALNSKNILKDNKTEEDYPKIIAKLESDEISKKFENQENILKENIQPFENNPSSPTEYFFIADGGSTGNGGGSTDNGGGSTDNGGGSTDGCTVTNTISLINGCIDPDDINNPNNPSNNSGGGSNTVPTPNSGYLLLTGAIGLAIIRFKKKTIRHS